MTVSIDTSDKAIFSDLYSLFHDVLKIEDNYNRWTGGENVWFLYIIDGFGISEIVPVKDKDTSSMEAFEFVNFDLLNYYSKEIAEDDYIRLNTRKEALRHNVITALDKIALIHLYSIGHQNPHNFKLTLKNQ